MHIEIKEDRIKITIYERDIANYDYDNLQKFIDYDFDLTAMYDLPKVVAYPNSVCLIVEICKDGRIDWRYGWTPDEDDEITLEDDKLFGTIKKYEEY